MCRNTSPFESNRLDARFASADLRSGSACSHRFIKFYRRAVAVERASPNFRVDKGGEKRLCTFDGANYRRLIHVPVHLLPNTPRALNIRNVAPLRIRHTSAERTYTHSR